MTFVGIATSGLLDKITVSDMGGMVISANVVQFPTPGEMERHLLELLAKVRAGEVTYLTTTHVDLSGVIEQREIDEFV